MPPGAKERAAIETVAARVVHAMHESHGPVDRMGAALERMMRALARSARALERLRAAGQASAGEHPDSAGRAALADLEECRESLEREVAVCIESLQFHDRLMQHLEHVRGGLATLGGKPSGVGCEPRKPDLGTGSVELF